MKLKISELKELALKNGGFSLSPEGATPKTGYMVSVKDILKMPLDLWLELEDQASIDAYTEIASKIDGYVGGWIDNNNIYIDIAANIQDKEKALQAAKRNEQLAIYDIENGSSIYL